MANLGLSKDTYTDVGFTAPVLITDQRYLSHVAAHVSSKFGAIGMFECFFSVTLGFLWLIANLDGL
jgi:hypothetical protein